jgi:hypothetical protein
MNSENSNENGSISMQDAISLLSTPPTEDTVNEEAAQEQEAPTLQAEAEDIVEEVIETDAPDDVEYEAEDEGEYDDEGEEPEEEDEQPEVYTVKVDGEEYEVTLDELQSGYSRQQAYTKRSQELAEQRKAFEQEASQVKAMRDAYAQQLELLKGQIQQTTQQEPDWSALAGQYSTEDLFLMKAEFDKQKESLARVEAEQRQIAQQQAQEQQAQMQEHLAKQRTEMLDRIPSWQNEETRNEERLEVIKYAQQRVGFSEEEIANASDARAIELLYKAWQWDKLQQKTPAAKKKARKAPKMAKSGQPKGKAEVASRQRRKALDKLDKLKSVDAAVEYLMGR